MVVVADLCASMSRMEVMLQRMNEILDRFNEVPGATTNPTATSSATSTTAHPLLLLPMATSATTSTTAHPSMTLDASSTPGAAPLLPQPRCDPQGGLVYLDRGGGGAREALGEAGHGAVGDEVPGATTHPTEFASSSAGTRAAGTAAVEGATDDDAPLQLPPADANGVPASGAGAGESTGPAAVALLPSTSPTTASSSLAQASDVTTAASASAPPDSSPALAPSMFAPAMEFVLGNTRTSAIQVSSISMSTTVPSTCSTESSCRVTYAPAPISLAVVKKITKKLPKARKKMLGAKILEEMEVSSTKIMVAASLPSLSSSSTYNHNTIGDHVVVAPMAPAVVPVDVPKHIPVMDCTKFRLDLKLVCSTSCCVFDRGKNRKGGIAMTAILPWPWAGNCRTCSLMLPLPRVQLKIKVCLLPENPVVWICTGEPAPELTSMAPMQVFSTRTAINVKVDTITLAKFAPKELVNNGNNDYVKMTLRCTHDVFLAVQVSTEAWLVKSQQLLTAKFDHALSQEHQSDHNMLVRNGKFLKIVRKEFRDGLLTIQLVHKQFLPQVGNQLILSSIDALLRCSRIGAQVACQVREEEYATATGLTNCSSVTELQLNPWPSFDNAQGALLLMPIWSPIYQQCELYPDDGNFDVMPAYFWRGSLIVASQRLLAEELNQRNNQFCADKIFATSDRLLEYKCSVSFLIAGYKRQSHVLLILTFFCWTLSTLDEATSNWKDRNVSCIYQCCILLVQAVPAIQSWADWKKCLSLEHHGELIEHPLPILAPSVSCYQTGEQQSDCHHIQFSSWPPQKNFFVQDAIQWSQYKVVWVHCFSLARDIQEPRHINYLYEAKLIWTLSQLSVSIKKFPVIWDPGGSFLQWAHFETLQLNSDINFELPRRELSFHRQLRLEGKPHFKQGGMSWTGLPASHGPSGPRDECGLGVQEQQKGGREGPSKKREPEPCSSSTSDSPVLLLIPCFPSLILL